MDIKVIVTTHKKYRMPMDAMYLPVRVREKVKMIWDMQAIIQEITFLMSPRLCELTGINWQ